MYTAFLTRPVPAGYTPDPNRKTYTGEPIAFLAKQRKRDGSRQFEEVRIPVGITERVPENEWRNILARVRATGEPALIIGTLKFVSSFDMVSAECFNRTKGKPLSWKPDAKKGLRILPNKEGVEVEDEGSFGCVLISLRQDRYETDKSAVAGE